MTTYLKCDRCDFEIEIPLMKVSGWDEDWISFYSKRLDKRVDLCPKCADAVSELLVK